MEEKFSLLSFMFCNQEFSTAMNYVLSVGYDSIEQTLFVLPETSGSLENAQFESFSVHLVKRFTCTRLNLYKKPKKQ